MPVIQSTLTVQSATMRKEQLISQVAIAILVLLPIVLAKVGDGSSGRRVPKQVHTKGAVIESEADHNAAETGFGAAGIGGHGKYFQDIYVQQSSPEEIEFGHVCENPHEWEQRFERKDLGQHRHQGQVRWGDKHGGYGEHFWDYNHAGHGGEEGGEEGGSEGGYSEPVPQYHHHHAPSAGKVTAKRQSPPPSEEERPKRQKNYDDGPRLFFNLATGQVVDEITGQVYALQPLN